MEKALILFYLAVCARSDIRGGYISLPLSLLVLFIRMIWLFVIGINPLTEISGMLLGATLYLLSLLTRQVGEGDALMIGVVGYVTGTQQGARILAIALVLLLIRKGWNRWTEEKRRYPLAPYILAGFFVNLIKMQGWQPWR